MTSSPLTAPPTATYRRLHRRGHHLACRALAAEHRPGYDPCPAAGSAVGSDAGSDVGSEGDVGGDAAAAEVPPFGLPVLAELPELAGVLESLVAADDRLLAAVDMLARLVDSGQVEHTTGVSIDHWLAIVARHTRLDRRLLLRLCRLTGRLPSLAGAVAARQISFAQLRGIGLALRDAPGTIDADLDRLLSRLLPELVGADPDALITQLRRAVDELTPDHLDAAERGSNRHLTLQPNLTGTGGRFSGETDSLGLALLDEATAPTRTQLDHPGGTGAARHDNLLTRLTHTCPTAADPAGDDAHDDDGAGEDGVADEAARAHGGAGEDGDDSGALPPVQLLVRVELATLLDEAATPAQLLTRLVGGRLRLTAATTRQLVATRGASLRTLVIDHGTVIGVGRRTRIPPGWLADATLAVHDTCTGPLCDRPLAGQREPAQRLGAGGSATTSTSPGVGAGRSQDPAASARTSSSSSSVTCWRRWGQVTSPPSNETSRSDIGGGTRPSRWRPASRGRVERVVVEQPPPVAGDHPDRLDQEVATASVRNQVKLMRTQPGLIPSQPSAIARSNACERSRSMPSSRCP
jgi:hypothetical protein